MPVLPSDKIYLESTAAQLLRPRVDCLVKDGGLDYNELNRRIVAENRVENIPVDHNPIYGGISKEVCSVERYESFNIDDRFVYFDSKCYKLEPRKLFIKTSDSSVVASATGFYGDNITIKVNKLLDVLSTKATSLLDLDVSGVFELDKVKLIIDESIINPWNIDFEDEDAITLKINPLKKNVIPVIFTPNDEKKQKSWFNVELFVLDERPDAVIPEIKKGTYITLASLTNANATSFKDKKGQIKTNISGSAVVIEGEILDSKTKNQLTPLATCEILEGNVFPETPTNYDMSGIDDVSKLRRTLFANVVIKQNSIRDLNVVLPIVYLEDTRSEAVPVTTLTFEQISTVEITYLNSGNTFRGDACKLDASVVSSSLNIVAKDADDSDVPLTISEVIVERSLNKDQKSSKAHVLLTNDDGRLSQLTYDIVIEDNRPFRAVEHYTVTNTFSVTIDSNTWNAGLKGQEWEGDSLVLTGSWSKAKNQFGREILPTDVLYSSFRNIDTNNSILKVDSTVPVRVLKSSNSAGSTEAETVLYLLLNDMSVLSIPLKIKVVDNRA